MTLRISHLLRVTTCLLAAAACDQSRFTEPANAAGQYALVAYGGQPLPIPYGVVVVVPQGSTNAVACDRVLAADTLALGTMRFTRRQTFRLGCAGVFVPSSVTVSVGSYTLDGDAVRFAYETAAESPLGATFSMDAERRGDSLVVARTTVAPPSGTFEDDSTTLRFVRVP